MFPTVFKSLRWLADWAYPVGCVICRRECHSRVPICAVCRRRLPVFADPMCPDCGSFAFDGERSPVCQAHTIGKVALVWCAGMFDDGYRPLVHALKYERQLGVGEHFGRRIGLAMRRKVRRDAAGLLAVPVPQHPSREKYRGYNQSAAIARGLVRVASMTLSCDLLARVRKTKDQTRLSPADREANVRGAFRVTEPGCFAEKDVILVDDVMTTGATLMECARMILADGASRVDAAVIAMARPPGAAS